MTSQPRSTVLSGIRATGQLHLGNLIGAVRHFVELSRDPDKQCLFFVADLHTLTTLPNPKAILSNLPEIVLDYIAAGVDLNNSILFAQSSVPETSELNWLLGNLMPVGDLERCPSYKDKVSKLEGRKQPDPDQLNFLLQQLANLYGIADVADVVVSIASGASGPNAGLLNYPILMAADILGPRAHIVPIGDDQRPHLEMTRELARRFNRTFGELFPIPEPIEGPMVRVPGLDGTTKMGKSEGNTINLTDPPKVVRQKVMRAPTDAGPSATQGVMSPAVENLFVLLELVAPPEVWGDFRTRYSNGEAMYGELKGTIADYIVEMLTPFQQRRQEIAGDTQLVERALVEGGKRAREIIAPTVREAQRLMGVGTYLRS